MGRLKGTVEVVMDGQDLGFCVKMVNGTHLHTAAGYAEGGVLDTLQFLDGGGGGVGEPNGGGVGEEGGDEGFVCEDEGLLALSQRKYQQGPSGC